MGDTREIVDLRIQDAFPCVARLLDGWDWHIGRKCWWRWGPRDEMNVRTPRYATATSVEKDVMAVYFGSDVDPS